MITFEFNILMGLPGSGKTYYAEHNFNTNTIGNHNGSMIARLDNYKGNPKWIYLALNEELQNYMEYRAYCNFERVRICVDGPIFTKESLYNVIDECIAYLKKKCKWGRLGAEYAIEFIVQQWEENREYCLYNDEARGREVSAEQTIKNQPYDIVDDIVVKKYLKETYPEDKFTVKYAMRGVIKTNLYTQRFVPRCGNTPLYTQHPDEKERYMYSDEWCLGGEWGNCWGDLEAVSAESPKEFVELDEFIEQVAPNITFMQYKKIKNQCVDMIDWHEHDYYSSGTNNACWRCDMRKLYTMLKEMGYINESES